MTASTDFWERASEVVAPQILGWQLTHDSSLGRVSVLLTEVEAYAGEADPASHAARGRTPRTEVMFGRAGRLYVYFSYGMHWCANVVVGVEGEAAAVLLRAGRVTAGVDLARVRRGPRVPERGLARGPACLTQALGIGREHNGVDVLGDGPLRLEPGSSVAAEPIGSSGAPVSSGSPVSVASTGSAVSSGPRVGVSSAATIPWRFWITDDPTVSTYKRSSRAAEQ